MPKLKIISASVEMRSKKNKNKNEEDRDDRREGRWGEEKRKAYEKKSDSIAMFPFHPLELSLSEVADEIADEKHLCAVLHAVIHARVGPPIPTPIEENSIGTCHKG